MPPTLGKGKICYLEIPTTDIARSAEFYKKVFGWNIRQSGHGRTAFDDGVNEVSGSWVTGRPASPTPGLLVYIMVDSWRQRSMQLLRMGERSCSRLAATLLRLQLGSAILAGM